ncbi:hypothetical protein GUJ93_ZPchr0004g38414 [Zizania palustris]|uniref:Uncharacterized protein n=1 Tax=Zizania palustris TaxID=103762 RepID=A0A8J5SR79_ZIZPA|nr:hypothetical protein GUJ93_ZPchr0004g38414 [Zizania palustris]
MLSAPPHHPAAASMSPGRRLHTSRPPLQSAPHHPPSGLPHTVVAGSLLQRRPTPSPSPAASSTDAAGHPRRQCHHKSLLCSGSPDRWLDYTGRSPPPHALVPYDLIAGGHPLLLCVEMVSVASVLEAMGYEMEVHG